MKSVDTLSDLPYFLFDNVVPENSLKDVWEEILYLDKFTILRPEESATAYDENGIPKKSNKCFNFNEFYKRYTSSFIWTAMNQILEEDVVLTMTSMDRSFIFLPWCSSEKNQTLMASKYVGGDYYHSHTDTAFYTAILWLHDDQNKFNGGDFYFVLPNGDKHLVESKSNRMVVFPSVLQHEVSEIVYENENSSPRYAFSMFICPTGCNFSQ